MTTLRWPLSYQDWIEQINLSTCREERLNSAFKIVASEAGDEFIVADELHLVILKKPGGYTPKSSLTLIDVLAGEEFGCGPALDIGTGETGIIAHYLRASGLPRVTGCDIDPSAIHHAETSSWLARDIDWKIANLFPKGVFSTVVSNPPQMPMKNRGTPHDDGGMDGRKAVDRIIKAAPKHMSVGGGLYILCFDFLGVVEQYSQTKSPIVDIAAQQGFSCEVLGKIQRGIRKGGQTEKNIPWIQKQYPWYKFKRDRDGNSYHEVLILKLTLASR